ncbi:MAG: hypothetical protein JWM23_1110 [Microbacteriaceae bacterium]|jgi:hypothetical protein|nr:hypothetical protein [Microbacteriaceae bacterium]
MAIGLPRGTGSDSTVSSTAQAHAVRVESRAITCAAGAFVLAAISAAVVFHGTLAALWGGWSVGAIAIITGSVCGGIAFCSGATAAVSRLARQSGLRISLPRRVWDISALAFTHMAVYAMLCLALFAILQNAFKHLQVDTLTATMMVGLASAASAYFLYLSASSTNANNLSTLLAIMLAGGVLLSMISSRNSRWWEVNFSILGTTRDFSGLSFNLTMIIGGAAITILAGLLTQEWTLWATSRAPSARRRINVVKWSLVTIGTLLALVGLVPVSISLPVHNTVATSMVLVFLALVISLKRILPEFPRNFFLLSYAFLAGIVVSGVMFFPVGYYNLTAFELITSGLIFGWLVIFVRVTAAVTTVGDSH